MNHPGHILLGQNLAVGGEGHMIGPLAVIVPAAQLPPRGRREEQGLIAALAKTVATSQRLAIAGKAQAMAEIILFERDAADFLTTDRVP